MASAGRARIHERAARRRVVTGSPWLRMGAEEERGPPRWKRAFKSAGSRASRARDDAGCGGVVRCRAQEGSPSCSLSRGIDSTKSQS